MLKIFTNGCFDLLHIGHIDCFIQIKELYPKSKLIIGLNSDTSIFRLKGKDRPIVMQNERKAMLESIRYVDQVIIFDEDTPDKLIESIKPDIIVKGADYHKKEVVGLAHAKIGLTLIKFNYNTSTSTIIKKIKNSC